MNRQDWALVLREAAKRIEHLTTTGVAHADACAAMLLAILDADKLRHLADLVDATTGEGHSYPADAHRVVVVDGVKRFCQNRIVNDLLDRAWESRNGMDLNCIMRDQQLGKYTRDELKELYKLIGYSLDGYEGLRVHDDEEDEPDEQV